MGCAQSLPSTSTKNQPKFQTAGQTERLVGRSDRLKKPHAIPRLDQDGRLLPEELSKRTTCSDGNQSLILGSDDDLVHVQYACWSQRGYYPDDPEKANQDEFLVTTNFAGDKQDVMFAVYDGHGINGRACASLVKESLPVLIAKYVKQARVKKYKAQLQTQSVEGTATLFDPDAWPALDATEYQGCCEKAFLECNRSLQGDHKIDASRSGTTAITAHLHRSQLTICNVGDSRAVLGQWVDEKVMRSSNLPVLTERAEGRDGMILAVPLSKDQTPYRKDELERVKKLGAVVMTIDQMEGIEDKHENWGSIVPDEDIDNLGDPPRIWADGKKYPGTAFTRSLGDSLAESIGVTAHPEFVSRELTASDRILIIASDGIFEFVKNQEAIEICEQAESPLDACEKLVMFAYDRWLTYETRTDDITVVVCFLKCKQSAATATDYDCGVDGMR